jgi:GT2 family glycosyltransferase
MLLTVSIVVYRPNVLLLRRTIASLEEACRVLYGAKPGAEVALYLVDNGGLAAALVDLARLQSLGVVCESITGHGNVGFGPGHNLALARAASCFHLVLNPDIDLDGDALVQALDFMHKHAEAGLVTPYIADETGRMQYLCRRYPSLFNLFVRGFAPERVRCLFSERLAHYEMRDLINETEILWDPAIVSGCFMFCRTKLLQDLGGFDARYFLYFEDYDLSLRAHRLTRLVYVPQVRVVHHGGGAARKGWLHIRMFGASAFKFFSRFGWKWL